MVCSFTATIDGCTVAAVVKERAEAKATYETAIKEQKTAALLEKSAEQHDVFVIRLGNLDKGKFCSIAISYVCELKLEGEKARFTLPTVVAPRYSPTATASYATVRFFAVIADSVSFQASFVSRVPAKELPYKLTFKAEVTMPSTIT